MIYYCILNCCMLYCSMHLLYAIRLCAMLLYAILLCDILLYAICCIVSCCMLWCCIVCCFTLYCHILYCHTLYCHVLHCSTLQCHVLHCCMPYTLVFCHIVSWCYRILLYTVVYWRLWDISWRHVCVGGKLKSKDSSL